MATLSYSSAHAPYQQAPTALLPADSIDSSQFNCTDIVDQRILQNQMIEAFDTEIGRLMVAIGLASHTPDGGLDYYRETTKTMMIIVGDNGTFAPTVKAPFDPLRAKGTPYQTGVWVPLIVAGPFVNGPDREVPHMVNAAVDVFQLFGEIAGVDVRQVVPASHTLDAKSMLPYLTTPDQASIRTTNFTQIGTNLKPLGTIVPPCVLTQFNTCVQIFTFQELCEIVTITLKNWQPCRRSSISGWNTRWKEGFPRCVNW